MKSMNLSKYCIAVTELSADSLIAKTVEIQRDADVRSLIGTYNDLFGKILEQQYQVIAKDAMRRQFARRRGARVSRAHSLES